MCELVFFCRLDASLSSGQHCQNTDAGGKNYYISCTQMTKILIKMHKQNITVGRCKSKKQNSNKVTIHTCQVHHMHTEHLRQAHISLLCPWVECTGQTLSYIHNIRTVLTLLWTTLHTFASLGNFFLISLDKWQSFFHWWMSLLSPNQQCNEGKKHWFQIIATSSLMLVPLTH